jgi:hypothetical protein
VSRNFLTRLLIVFLFRTSLKGEALLNAQEQQQMITMSSDVLERTHVLLGITPCFHMHSFCATCVSSGLATRVTLTRVLQERSESLLHSGRPVAHFILCRIMCLMMGCILNGTSCISVLYQTIKNSLILVSTRRVI